MRITFDVNHDNQEWAYLLAERVRADHPDASEITIEGCRHGMRVSVTENGTRRFLTDEVLRNRYAPGVAVQPADVKVGDVYRPRRSKRIWHVTAVGDQLDPMWRHVHFERLDEQGRVISRDRCFADQFSRSITERIRSAT